MFFSLGMSFSLLLRFNVDTGRRKIIDDLKLLYSFLDSSLVDSQTDLYKESSATLKFNAKSCFSDQHPVLLYWNGVHSICG
jgi:hypothetical protein